MRLQVSVRNLLAGLLFVVALNSPTTAAADDPPTILGFDYMNPIGDYFVFTGWVVDEDPAGCIVGFDGILYGHYTTPDSDGFFMYVVQLQPWEVGAASAISFDILSQESNEEWLLVSY